MEINKEQPYCFIEKSICQGVGYPCPIFPILTHPDIKDHIVSFLQFSYSNNKNSPLLAYLVSTMDNSSEFRLFLANEKGKYRKKRTINLYMEQLARFLRVKDVVSPQNAVDYLLELQEKGRKGTYINDYVDLFHLWGRCFKTTEYDTINYFREEEFVQATMSDEEIEAFLALPPKFIERISKKTGIKSTYSYDEKSWKQKTLFWKIMAWTGMRPGEVSHLKASENIDFGINCFVLYPEFVKTNDSRRIPIPVRVLDELKEYIKSLEGDWLFPSKQGGLARDGLPVYSDVDWNYDFHERLKRLGIRRKNLRPNSLRPSFITRMLSEDVDIFKVQRIVGHKRIEQTAHYTHLVTTDLRKAMEKDPMAAKGLKRTKLLQQELERIRKFKESFGDLINISINEVGKKMVEVKYVIDDDLE